MIPAAPMWDTMASPRLADLRSVYRRKGVEAIGLEYSSIGRPAGVTTAENHVEAAQ